MHACAGVFVVCLCVCASWVMVSAALTAVQFAGGEQITVFASLPPHRREILVSTAQILLSIYRMDYIRPIIGDNGAA